MNRIVRVLVCLLAVLGCWSDASWGQGTPVLDGANAFITLWKGEAGKPIQVPLYGNYAYRWEKADGTVIKDAVANVAYKGLLVLPVVDNGEYVLKAGPLGVKRIGFGVSTGYYSDVYGSSRGTPKALLQVKQWGSVQWESFAGAFYGCENMNIAEGAGSPDLSDVWNMQAAFKECRNFNSPIGDWDVSQVTYMRSMFDECSAFNQPLERWNVSKVGNMSAMFYKCSSFNQPLGDWTVSQVKDMSAMFSGCVAFNQPLARWDVSKVTDMGAMFSGCVAFNQPLARWDVSKVTNMGAMFNKCSSFNQPLARWDVSKVRNMWGMFQDCSAFDQSLAAWTPSGLESSFPRMSLGFEGMGWSVENYSKTLVAWAGKKDQLKNGVRVAVNGLFYNAEGAVARQALEDTKEWSFFGDGLAQPAESFDLSKAFITRWQGQAGVPIEVPLQGWYWCFWERSDATLITYRKAYVPSGQLLKFFPKEDGEYVLKVYPYGVKRIEFGKWEEGLKSFNGSRGTPSALKEVVKWGSVEWEDFAGAFYGCENVTIAEGAGRPNLSGVKSMRSAFEGCGKFNSPIGDWDVSKVTDMGDMFEGCSAFNQPLGGWTLSSLTERLGLAGSGLSMANYSSSLLAWAGKRDQLKNGVRVNAQRLFYDAASGDARQLLIDEKKWEFSGDFPEFDLPNAFVTRWQGKAGEQVRVPLYGRYSYRWEKADGTEIKVGGATLANGDLLELPVSEDGEYVLRAGPSGVKRIHFANDNSTRSALKQVAQWGGVTWESFAGAFYGCENMTTAEGADRPDLSGVTSMESAFEGCAKFNSPIGDWRVSQVTNMGRMFRGCMMFNQPLGEWDVSRVTDMGDMFEGCSAFNQPLGGRFLL